MPFDPVTILVSAVAGGLSGIVFASLKTGREEIAKRRSAAKDQVHDAVSEVLINALAAEAGLHVVAESGEIAEWSDSYPKWVSAVVIAARKLGPVRQRLVKRRLRILVGDAYCAMAYARPLKPGEDPLGVKISLDPLRIKPVRFWRGHAGLVNYRGTKSRWAIRKKARRHLTRLSKSR